MLQFALAVLAPVAFRIARMDACIHAWMYAWMYVHVGNVEHTVAAVDCP